MKTVIDAVNEFKGDIRNSEHTLRTKKVILESTLNDSTWEKGELVVDDANYTPTVFRQVCTVDDFNKCVEEMTNMNIKPIYTQEMVDAGVIPLVGMECLRSFSATEWVKTVICGQSPDGAYASYYDGNGLMGWADNCKFKPLDTRTDKEKAFDEHFTDSGCAYKYQSILKSAFEAGVTWSGK